MRFPPTNPWHHADIADRGYITPEDITAARDAGANGEELLRIVLVAIGQGEVEDKAACAYVATEASSPKERAPAQPVRITNEAEADAHFGERTEMAEWAKCMVVGLMPGEAVVIVSCRKAEP